MWSSPSSVRRPVVTVGGCSSRRIVSGAPSATAAATERCSSHASLYGTRPRFMTYAALVVRLSPALELGAQVAQEAARERAVDEAVVVREGQVHDRADR